ncbi:hypothetical protein BGZ73_006049 [Actinomortierella ambigua]|nr:hypothetical protein BGZ73_006049 [Actinomortierella ambigua]
MDTAQSYEDTQPSRDRPHSNSSVVVEKEEEEIQDISKGGLTPQKTPASLHGLDESVEPPYGWVVVGASFFIQALIVGTINSFGAYQDLYVKDMYKTAATSQISLIGSLTPSVMNTSGLITGSIADYFGYRVSALSGAIIMTVALLLASMSRQLWHLYLTQGCLYGIGGSLAFLTSITIPSQWFKKRRGLATGITAAGGGVGGLILSPVIVALLERIGYRWTLSVMALIHLVILVPAAALFRCRVENGKERRRRLEREKEAMTEEAREILEAKESIKKYKVLDFSVMREAKFLLLFSAIVSMAFGYTVPLFYLPTYARLNGISVSTSSLLVGILNGSSGFGRLLMGMASDYVGDVNSMVVSMFLSSVGVLAMWVFAKSLPVLVIFCVFYGFWSGSCIALVPSVSAHLCVAVKTRSESSPCH